MFRTLLARSRRSNPAAPRRTAARFQLETLEGREVPAAVFVVAPGAATDAAHFTTLTAALAAAGAGGTVTLEGGSQRDAGTVTVTQAGVTIQADSPAVSAYAAARDDLQVNASGVVLRNLDLGAVTLGGGAGGLQVLGSTLNTLTESGTTGAGGNVFQFDRVLGSVALTGGAGGRAADTIADTVFTGAGAGATPMLALTDDSGAQVLRNTFGGGGTFGPDGALGQKSGGSSDPAGDAVIGPAPGVLSTRSAIAIRSTSAAPQGLAGVLVQGNVITAPAAFGIAVTTSAAAAGVAVLGNSVYVPGGTGLLITAGSDASTQVLVQGNDFSGDAVGVGYSGSGGGPIGSDLGGGGLGSMGGNIFNAYAAPAAPGAAAVAVSGVGAGAVLAATGNVFGVADPTTVISGAAAVNAGGALAGPAALAQTLYVSLLGRAASAAELQGWVNDYATAGGGAAGRAVVTNGLMNSAEALGRMVNGIYVDCLDRTADAGGLAGWVGLIQNGGTLEQVITGIVTSVEWQQKNPGEPVEVYYENQLHRAADPTGLAAFEGVLSTQGLQAVPLGIVRSPEFRTGFGQTVEAQMLHTTASAAALQPVAQNGSVTLLQEASQLFAQAALPGG